MLLDFVLAARVWSGVERRACVRACHYTKVAKNNNPASTRATKRTVVVVRCHARLRPSHATRHPRRATSICMYVHTHRFMNRYC